MRRRVTEGTRRMNEASVPPEEDESTSGCEGRGEPLAGCKARKAARTARLVSYGSRRRRIRDVREGWRRCQAVGEVAHEGNHRGVPPAAEPERVHFVQSLLRGPVFDGHPVG